MDDPLISLVMVVAFVAIAFTLFGTITVISDVSNSRGYGHQERPPRRIYPLWLRISIAAAMMLFLAIVFFGPWEYLSNRAYLVFAIQVAGYLAYDAYLWLRQRTAGAPRSNLS
jgi:hypothetical protein